MSAAADERYMHRALLLAERGLAGTDPNPRVGCVLVRAERTVGEGWHERAGGPHAEVMALQQAGADAAGASAYITLEPCSHTGRTPPCVAALISAGVRRVVYAVGDPNPLVNGAGAAALRAAGVEVQDGVLAAQARALNPGFFKRMQCGLPWVRLKLAASLDGRTALADGQSRWITGEAARADVQRFRARSSVVLTGSGTVLADDPALNVRLPNTPRQPLRVLLDSTLRVGPDARVLKPAHEALIFTASPDDARRAALERRGVRVETTQAGPNGRLLLAPLLRRLGALEANEVWIEAGAELAGAWLREQLVDELVIYLAPRLLGPAARPLLELPAPAGLAQAPRLRFTECVRLGEDLRVCASPLPPEGPAVPAAVPAAAPAVPAAGE